MQKELFENLEIWGFSEISLDFEKILTKMIENSIEMFNFDWFVFANGCSMLTHLNWGWSRTRGRQSTCMSIAWLSMMRERSLLVHVEKSENEKNW